MHQVSDVCNKEISSNRIKEILVTVRACVANVGCLRGL